jgi:hypothetical protein
MFYVAGFVSAQALVLLLVLASVHTRWFLRHDDYPGMWQSGYGARLKDRNCDVVLYGDSSALTGLRPDVIQQITGLKTCNISEGVTIQGVVGSGYPLDEYLANNKRPRFLLMMYTPSVFRPYLAPFSDYKPEGMIYAFEYDRTEEWYRGLLRHRQWLLDFVIWSGHAILQDGLDRFTAAGRAKVSVDTRAQREGENGVWPYPRPPETYCVRTAYHMTPAMIVRYADSVETMRRLYSVDGTQVIIDVAPVPTCDTLQQAYREKSEGLHDNAFETLPISYFNEGDVHFTPEGGRIISVEAANQILALDGQGQGNRASVGKTAGQPK